MLASWERGPDIFQALRLSINSNSVKSYALYRKINAAILRSENFTFVVISCLDCLNVGSDKLFTAGEILDKKGCPKKISFLKFRKWPRFAFCATN